MTSSTTSSIPSEGENGGHTKALLALLRKWKLEISRNKGEKRHKHGRCRRYGPKESKASAMDARHSTVQEELA